MSYQNEEKFVVKQEIQYPLKCAEDGILYGDVQEFAGYPWQVTFEKQKDEEYTIRLTCLNNSTEWWYINTVVDIYFQMGYRRLTHYSSCKNQFAHHDNNFYIDGYEKSEIEQSTVDGSLKIEFEVKIEKKGIHRKLKDFEEKSEFSDVILDVEGQEFHVNKMYLATHCTYFKSMFFGNFSEDKKEKIELKEVVPYYLQRFLELIYGEDSIGDHCVHDLLALTDMYDSATALKKIEKFLIFESDLEASDKLNITLRYDMPQLTKNCLAEITDAEVLREEIPDNPESWKKSVWKEVSLKLAELCLKEKMEKEGMEKRGFFGGYSDWFCSLFQWY